MKSEKNFYTIPALIVGVCLIVGTFVVAQAFYNVRALANSISVTGSAERIITSDMAKWTATITRTVPVGDVKGGSAQMKRDLAAVLEYYRGAGVTENEITVQPVTMMPVCESNQNVMYDRYGNQTCSIAQTTGYAFREDVVVESSDVQKIAKISREASDALISRGVIFSSQNVEYYYTQLKDLRLQLLAEATQNARERSQKIAESTSAKIGKLQSANMGVFQITAKNSTDVSDYGTYDTSSLEKKVTAIVRASFSLK